MGIQQTDFVKCFVLTLTSEEVVNKIDNVISASLRMDITKLTESNEKLSRELSTYRDMHTERRWRKGMRKFRHYVPH